MVRRRDLTHPVGQPEQGAELAEHHTDAKDRPTDGDGGPREHAEHEGRHRQVDADGGKLRERQGDSVLLAQFLLQQSADRFARMPKGLAPDAIRAIQGYKWPGNVRELENRIRSAVLMSEGKVVTAADLGLQDPGEDPDYLNLRVARNRAEMQAIVAGNRFDRSRAQGLLEEKTRAVQASGPEVINALADFYDSLDAEQQQKVRDWMHKRRSGWMVRS